MSATGHSDRTLEAARDHLLRRGYLGTPPPTRPRWRRGLRLLAWAGFFALFFAAVSIAATREDPSAVLVVTLALLPLCAVALALARVTGRVLASALLRAGGQPRAISGALASLAAFAILGAGAGAVSATHRTSAALLAVLLIAVAAVAVWIARRTNLAIHQSLTIGGGTPDDPSQRPARPWATVVFTAAAGVFVTTVLLLSAHPKTPPPTETPAAFPARTGRVAVIAVDGLAREDFEAARELSGDTLEILDWGWADLTLAPTALPAVRWTTIACGASPRRHGVEVMDEVILFGRRDGVALAPALQAALVSTLRPFGAARVVARPALTRRLPTFWEMASRAGCPVSVGGWWSSWPIRRLLGTVASERAWLGGGWGRDAVTEDSQAMVSSAWLPRGAAADITDHLAMELASAAAHTAGPRLVALWMPGADLERRSGNTVSTLTLASRLVRHLEALEAVVGVLRGAGFDTWVVGVPWSPGTPFIASSRSVGRFAPVDELELASTWLDQLGLPQPVGLPEARRDLSDVLGPRLPAIAYGPPPLPLAAPSPAGAAVQREVLRSLGYLR